MISLPLTKTDWFSQGKKVWAINCGFHYKDAHGGMDHEKSKDAVVLRFPTEAVRDYIFELIERDLNGN